MEKKSYLKDTVLIVVLIVVAILVFFGPRLDFSRLTNLFATQTVQTGEVSMNQTGVEIIGRTRFLGKEYISIVSGNQILSGGPPPDGIPAIDNPKFISASEADKFLQDDEIVFAIFLNGIAKAYPKQILVWHEIANDKFADKPVLVTYCPLCGTAIAFEGKVDGEESTFGTSGNLYKSNLVMYDRKTKTLWSQVRGEAIAADPSFEKLLASRLKQLPIDTLLYGEWKKLHPDTLVLSRDTGISRPYGVDPYGNYYSSSDVGFGVSFTDTRLHPKAMVAGILVNDSAKAYPVSEVEKVGFVVNDIFKGKNILVIMNPNLQTGFELNSLRVFDRGDLQFEIKDGKLFDKTTNSEWSFDGVAISGELKDKKLEILESKNAMWFSWLSTNEDTELFLAK